MPRKTFSMPKLVLAVSALFLLGSTSACSTSGTSEADKSTTTTVERSTTSEGDGTTTTVDEPASTTTTTTKSAGDADAKPYVTALAENLVSNTASQGDLAFTADQSECTATAWVDIIGVDALDSNGIHPNNLGYAGFPYHELGLDEGQAEDMVAAVEDCGVDWITGTRDALKVGLDRTGQLCLDDELTDETIQALLVQSIYLSAPEAELKAEIEYVEEVCEL